MNMVLISNPSSLFYISMIFFFCYKLLHWSTPWRPVDALQPVEHQIQVHKHQFPASWLDLAIFNVVIASQLKSSLYT